MTRYFPNKKATVENCQNISVVSMKAAGVFRGNSSGNFTWRRAVVGFSFDLERKELRLQYAFTNLKDDPSAIQDYIVSLSTTSCRYGGVRYWLHCPKCQKRVGKIYLAGKYVFACRKCWNLTYEICNASGDDRIQGRCLSLYDVEEMGKKIKRHFYNGIMTKQYRRFLKHQKKALEGHQCVISALMDRVKKRQK